MRFKVPEWLPLVPFLIAFVLLIMLADKKYKEDRQRRLDAKQIKQGTP